jgi:hypothetical protein
LPLYFHILRMTIGKRIRTDTLSPIYTSYSTFMNLSADIVFERIQSLSKKEFALGGPMDIGPRMSEDTVSADIDGIHVG